MQHAAAIINYRSLYYKQCWYRPGRQIAASNATTGRVATISWPGNSSIFPELSSQAYIFSNTNAALRHWHNKVTKVTQVYPGNHMIINVVRSQNALITIFTYLQRVISDVIFFFRKLQNIHSKFHDFFATHQHQRLYNLHFPDLKNATVKFNIHTSKTVLLHRKPLTTVSI